MDNNHDNRKKGKNRQNYENNHNDTRKRKNGIGYIKIKRKAMMT